MTQPPSAEEQLTFLTNFQRLLAEGQFVATYKYALLLALADLAVEDGNDSGAEMPIQTRRIAEKFIELYWRQTVPYVPRHRPDAAEVLRQNTGRQAEIIGRVEAARARYGGSLADARRDTRAWQALVNHVDRVVRVMPLWRLQTVGTQALDFLYENVGEGRLIVLRPGVSYCLRQFHLFIGELVRNAWIRYVRRQNQDALGTTTDLSEFLFGSERTNLSAVGAILREVQSGGCFYCADRIPARAGHVDHFIPWSRYASDLGHNFVLACGPCNCRKSDHLPAQHFLMTWGSRNQRHYTDLAQAFDKHGIVHDLNTSVRIATWAYQQTADTGGLTWARPDDMQKLSPLWREEWLELVALSLLTGEDGAGRESGLA
jgi:5-methylcytosine-specific restriction endonuclease McrA